jgi:hypothetical protein
MVIVMYKWHHGECNCGSQIMLSIKSKGEAAIENGYIAEVYRLRGKVKDFC